jgi:hypothetical protein
MSKIQEQLDALSKERDKLLDALDKEHANKQIRCICGKMHRIKNCEAIQTYWYTSPHGCTGGDYWNEGELRFVCPDDPEVINRLLFSSSYAVPYDKREHYAHNAEDQFKRKYKRLFKSVTDDYDKDHLGIRAVNYYIDHNHAKFSIDIGFPYTPTIKTKTSK